MHTINIQTDRFCVAIIKHHRHKIKINHYVNELLNLDMGQICFKVERNLTLS